MKASLLILALLASTSAFSPLMVFNKKPLPKIGRAALKSAPAKGGRPKLQAKAAAKPAGRPKIGKAAAKPLGKAAAKPLGKAAAKPLRKAAPVRKVSARATPAAKGRAAPAASAAGSPWSDPSFAGGLPGVLAPAGPFDPLGLAAKRPQDVRRYREAEVTHGRVAMLAAVGFLVGEKVEGSSFLFDSQITGPAIGHLAQVPAEFWSLLVVGIGASESLRSETGWEDPSATFFSTTGKNAAPGKELLPNSFFGKDKLFQLKPGYTPGDIDFDPLNIRPTDPVEFEEMQTKELQHGRLAMIGVSGMCVQELVDGQGILEHLANARG
ncbi:hypothetical protein TeGR_g4321 [Tetraparma gracilis]|uniref:Uncharacterized protein n=1 Tax=Tetraparma gracilis TaxID=2962635 RepID=A0ABQ6M4F4_9STRA|nr:hypothetical protein TeGR_g4321 [Tetraparma gracilis]